MIFALDYLENLEDLEILDYLAYCKMCANTDYMRSGTSMPSNQTARLMI